MGFGKSFLWVRHLVGYAYNFITIWLRLMIAPKGASMKKHGPYTFKPPQDIHLHKQQWSRCFAGHWGQCCIDGLACFVGSFPGLRHRDAATGWKGCHGERHRTRRQHRESWKNQTPKEGVHQNPYIPDESYEACEAYRICSLKVLKAHSLALYGVTKSQHLSFHLKEVFHIENGCWFERLCRSGPKFQRGRWLGHCIHQRHRDLGNALREGAGAGCWRWCLYIILHMIFVQNKEFDWWPTIILSITSIFTLKIFASHIQSSWETLISHKFVIQIPKKNTSQVLITWNLHVMRQSWRGLQRDGCRH